MHHQTTQRRRIEPSSMTSVNTLTSYTSKSSTENFRYKEIPRFQSSEEFQKVIIHIHKNQDKIPSQQRSSQEVAQRAIALLETLAPAVDSALNKAFAAGILSSGSENPNDPDEFYPTEGSQRCVSKTSSASRLEKVQIAAGSITMAIKKFNDLNTESVPNPDDPRFNMTAMQHWLQHDKDLHEAAQDYFTEIKDRLEQSLHIAAEYSSRQPVAGNKATSNKFMNDNNTDKPYGNEKIKKI